MKIEA